MSIFYTAKQDLATLPKSDILAFAVHNNITTDHYNDLLWLIALKIHGNNLQQNAEMISGSIATFSQKLYPILAASAHQKKDRLFPAGLTDHYVQTVAQLAREQKEFKKKLKRLSPDEKRTQDAALKKRERQLMADPQWAFLQNLVTLIKADPAPPAWIVDAYSNDGIKRLEDIGSRLTVALKDFAWLKKKGIIGKKIKLTDFCGLIGCWGKPGLEPFLGKYADKLIEFHVEQEETSKAATEGKLIYESPKAKIIHPTTKEAAIYYGQGTKWCTAARQNNMFEHYNKDGPMYIIIPKKPQYTGEKYQLHAASKQYRNEKDESINLDRLMVDYPELLEAPIDNIILNIERALREKNINRASEIIKNDPAGIPNLSTRQFLLLLDNGLDPNINIQGDSLLIIQINENNKEIAELLIKAGADINYKNNKGATALSESIRNVIDEAFIDKGIAELLLKAGAKMDKFTRDQYLLLKVIKNNYKQAELLIKDGADVNVTNDKGQTSLWFANDAKMGELLIKAGININATNNIGNTALFETARLSDFLIKAGANINHKNNLGETALMKALDDNHVEKINALVKAGADVNQLDKYRLLKLYIYSGNIEKVKSLIKDTDIDINQVNQHGETLFSKAVDLYAVDPKYYSILLLLLETGVDDWIIEETLEIAKDDEDTKLINLLNRFID